MTLPSDAPNGFRAIESGLEWSGPVDGPESPPVVVEVGSAQAGYAFLERALREGDPDAGDQAVRAIAMPLGMIDGLARRCTEQSPGRSLELAAGASGPDARWQSALAGVLRAQDGSGGNVTARPPVLYMPAEGLSVRALHAMPSGRVAVLSTDLRYGQNPVRATLAFEGDDGAWVLHRFDAGPATEFGLPATSTESVWLTEQHPPDGATVVRQFAADGSLLSTHEQGPLSPVQSVSAASGRHWLHAERQHALLEGERGDPPLLLEHGDERTRPFIVGGALLVFSPKELDRSLGGWVSRTLRWVELASATLGPELPWNQLVHGVVVVGGAVFVGTARGLFVLTPGCPPERVFEDAVYGLGARGDQLVFVSATAAHVFDASTRQEVRRVSLPTFCIRCALTDGVLAAWDMRRVWVFDREDALLYDSGLRREPALVELEDGSAVVSAGEVVTTFDREGRLVASGRADYDGQLVGATGSLAIFAPVSGGHAETEPTGLFAFDARARCVAHLPWGDELLATAPTRNHYGGGTRRDAGVIQAQRVLLVDRAGQLRTWTPAAGDQDGPTLPAQQRRETQRGAVVRGFTTTNPRDDWPVPGIVLSGERFLAFDCSWRGTTGVAPAPAVLVRDGAVVTLVRCDLAGEGGGAEVKQGSTLVLVDCRFEGAPIGVEPGSHLLVLPTSA